MAQLSKTSPSTSSWEPALDFSVHSDTTSSLIRLAGELDAESACLLHSVVEAHITHRHVELIVDVTRLRFIDVAGFRALRVAWQRLRENGGSLTVVHYDGFFAQLARLCDVEQILGRS